MTGCLAWKNLCLIKSTINWWTLAMLSLSKHVSVYVQIHRSKAKVRCFFSCITFNMPFLSRMRIFIVIYEISRELIKLCCHSLHYICYRNMVKLRSNLYFEAFFFKIFSIISKSSENLPQNMIPIFLGATLVQFVKFSDYFHIYDIVIIIITLII